MASAKEFSEYILGQLSELEGVRCAPMMGGYIFYIHDRIFGGIYETGFLVKDTPAAREHMPDAVLTPSEPGGSAKMLDCTILDDAEAFCAMVRDMYPQLPDRKKRKK